MNVTVTARSHKVLAKPKPRQMPSCPKIPKPADAIAAVERYLEGHKTKQGITV